MLEVVTITLLLRPLVPRGDPLASVGGVGLMLVAIVAGTTVSATIGALSLWLGDVIATGEIPMSVRAAASNGVLHVEVADDGVGGARSTTGSGLEGLRDRVEAIGGKLEVDSPAGRGTRILASLPATPPR